jgi:hypothetical protein
MSRVFFDHRRNGNGSHQNCLNAQDSESLLANFPNTRLSYEATIHKNDNQSLLSEKHNCFILPKGKRCIAWITEWKRNKIVAVIDIIGPNHSNNGAISPVIRKFNQENGWFPGNIRVYDACIHHSLVYGTVFGGVIFRLNPSQGAGAGAGAYDKTIFSIHAAYWYKGNPVPSLSLSGHVRLCEGLFHEGDLRQVAYTKQNSIIFSIPILCRNDKDADAIIPQLPYPVYAIQYRFEHNTRVCQRTLQTPHTTTPPRASEPHKSIIPLPPPPAVIVAAPTRRVEYIQPPDEMLTNIQAIFMVRPNIQNDIYDLFVSSTTERRNSDLIFHNFAHIPSYKTSVMMNKMFRNIVENRCLDALEESEDESDFENIEPDKYVSLHKEQLMLCRFNKRFCRWVPIEILTEQGSKQWPVITVQQVNQHEMRYLKYRRK